MFALALSIAVIVKTHAYDGLVGVDTFMLLGHACDVVEPLSSDEEANLHQLFNNIDLDNNNEISHDEFIKFVTPNLFQYESLFNQLDSNKNQNLEYDEIVSAFRMIYDKTLLDEVIVPAGNDEAEYIASVLLAEIDVNNNEYIKKEEFIDYYVGQEWMKFVDDSNAVKIIFEQFKNNIFNSYGFKAFKNEKFNSKCRDESDSVDIFIRLIQIDQVHQQMSSRHLGCYDEYDMVYERDTGLKFIKDVAVGDYVFDGSDYTKIYFTRTFDSNHRTNMLEIKYGEPSKDDSIILTGDHLIYKYGDDIPIIADEIEIGDILDGVDIDMNNDNNNYTVYSIKEVENRHPSHPITSSGKLMVNNIVTSVYTQSPLIAKRMHDSAVVFRWISDNIDENLAVMIIDFYYNTIYRKIIKQNDHILKLFTNSQTFATIIILSIPLIIATILYKAVKLNNKQI